MRQLALVLVSTLALLVAAAACGSDPTPTPEPTATPVPPTPTPTALAMADDPTPTAMPEPEEDPFEAEWEALIAAAQEEGEMIDFICCAFGRVADNDLLPFFEEKFGVRVVSSTGSSRQNADRVLAERQAGTYTLDMWHGGITTSNTRLAPNGVLANIKDAIIHPEVLDDSVWFGGGLPVMDANQEGLIIGYVGNASTAEISYNTDLFDPSELTSYWDLLDPKYAGKIVMRDPSEAGVGQGTAFYFSNEQLGPDFLRRLLTEQEYTIAPDARTAAEWLALGQYSICLFACGTEVETAKDQGLPVEDVFPHQLQEGSRISVGGNSLMLVDSGPNPNAAKLFANWFLSREGQDLFQKTNGDNSLREDISKDDVDVENLRLEGVPYVFSDREPEFQAILEDALAFTRDTLRSAGK